MRPSLAVAAVVAVGLLFAFAPSTFASSPLTHLAVGNIIGAAAGEDSWPACLAAGAISFMSHALLDTIDHDYTPNWVEWLRNPKSVIGDLPYLVVQVVGAAVLVASLDGPGSMVRICGMLGSVLPDLVEIPHVIREPKSWLDGRHVFPWHRADWQPGAVQQDQWVTVAISIGALWISLSL